MVFSSNEELEVGDQQTSLISSTEEAIQEEDVAVEDTGSEQQFGVFKDFDFLDVELEDAEVRPLCLVLDGSQSSLRISQFVNTRTDLGLNC